MHSVVGRRAHIDAMHVYNTQATLQNINTKEMIKKIGYHARARARPRRASATVCLRGYVTGTLLGTIVLTLGSQLLPRRVVSATITASPHARIVVLLLGLKRLGNTDGATLSICCLNASVALAWTAL